MSIGATTNAIVFEQPGKLALRTLSLIEPGPADLTVDVETSGISTGTEKLLWNGTMPAFPGLAYPLVPGYEATGTVRTAGSACHLKAGDRVFVPGASCFQGDVRGLFGASSSTLVVSEARVASIASMPNDQSTLLALAATAMHILTHQLRQNNPGQKLSITDIVSQAPSLIVGHGVLGRLLARICLAIGADAPDVWELDKQRQSGARGYNVLLPEDDDKFARQHIVDVSGSCGEHFNKLIARLSKGGRLTLGGFYNEPINFDFAPAFIREINLGIAAEWVPDDLSMTMSLIQAGALSLDGLVSHQLSFEQAEDAYPIAFNDPSCLKMLLNWSA